MWFFRKIILHQMHPPGPLDAQIRDDVGGTGRDAYLSQLVSELLRVEQDMDALFVIAGFNGRRPVEVWVRHLQRHGYDARAYSWRDANTARRDIAALAPGKRVILIGHSLGGGHAQRLVQSLPERAIDVLITVAAFAPRAMDHGLTRGRVGHWLNIVSAPQRRDWRDFARKLAGLLNWHEQGWIDSASENHLSRLPHQDFYKLMSERCGAVEHGQYRPVSA
jgi:pimeloyl-ACP methyl ester carboxylesterase